MELLARSYLYLYGFLVSTYFDERCTTSPSACNMEEVQVPSSDEDVSCADLFKEPEGHSPEEKGPTFASYTLSTGEVLSVRLVGHNPLWGHVLWNAARVAAGFLENNASDLVSGKDVLELGAGAGVPSLVCALRGARKVSPPCLDGLG